MLKYISLVMVVHIANTTFSMENSGSDTGASSWEIYCLLLHVEELPFDVVPQVSKIAYDVEIATQIIDVKNVIDLYNSLIKLCKTFSMPIYIAAIKNKINTCRQLLFMKSPSLE